MNRLFNNNILIGGTFLQIGSEDNSILTGNNVVIYWTNLIFFIKLLIIFGFLYWIFVLFICSESILSSNLKYLNIQHSTKCESEFIQTYRVFQFGIRPKKLMTKNKAVQLKKENSIRIYIQTHTNTYKYSETREFPITCFFFWIVFPIYSTRCVEILNSLNGG